jgi:hypothetical protein
MAIIATFHSDDHNQPETFTRAAADENIEFLSGDFRVIGPEFDAKKIQREDPIQ